MSNVTGGIQAALRANEDAARVLTPELLSATCLAIKKNWPSAVNCPDCGGIIPKGETAHSCRGCGVIVCENCAAMKAGETFCEDCYNEE